MLIVRTSNLSAIALLISCLSVPALPARAADWQWTLVPYLWASDIGVDVTVNNEPIIGVDIGFDDILDKTDFASQLHFKGRRGKGGFLLDITFLNLGARQTTVARPPLPGGTQIGSDMKTTLFEAGEGAAYGAAPREVGTTAGGATGRAADPASRGHGGATARQLQQSFQRLPRGQSVPRQILDLLSFS